MVNTYFGYGRHAYHLDIAQLTKVAKWLFIGEFMATPILCLVKVSVALFLLRIGGLRRWLKVLLLASTTLLISSTFTFVIILSVQCRPIAGNWDPVIRRTSKCFSTSVLVDIFYCSSGLMTKPPFQNNVIANYTFLIAISIFTDFLCAAIPFQIIGDLQMSRRNKASLLALLCLGFL